MVTCIPDLPIFFKHEEGMGGGYFILVNTLSDLPDKLDIKKILLLPSYIK